MTNKLAQAWNDEMLYQEVFEDDDDCILWFGQLNALALDESFNFLITDHIEDNQ